MFRTFAFLAMAVACLVATPVYADMIAVGSSSLIDTLDYSDTFTTEANGGLVGRDGSGTIPMTATALAVENCYGNSASSWSAGFGIVTSDTVSGTASYPGVSGAGSATGMTQTTGGGSDWGFQYGLRDNFIVQLDAVQPGDRLDILIGNNTTVINDNSNFGIIIRPESSGYPEVALYNNTVPGGPQDTGIGSGIATGGQWHNYAVHFDIPNRTVEVFIDESSLGVIDIDTACGGQFANLTLSSAMVGFGYGGQPSLLADNFQVGAATAVPEPSIIILLFGGLISLGIFRRAKK